MIALRVCLLACLVWMGGCAEPTQDEIAKRNDAIIAEAKKCVDAGMNAWPMRDLGGDVVGIRCEPKDHP